jgi:hypothetical protein
MFNDKLVILTYKNTIYQSKLKLLAIFVTILVCKQHTLSQTWTNVSKNSSKIAKNTEKWFARNISGEMWSQAICVWATLIQVNQGNSASVWWTVHARNRFETAYVVYHLNLWYQKQNW